MANTTGAWPKLDKNEEDAMEDTEVAKRLKKENKLEVYAKHMLFWNDMDQIVGELVKEQEKSAKIDFRSFSRFLTNFVQISQC